MIDKSIDDFKLDSFISYLYDHIMEDIKINSSLDLDELSYSSLHKRLVALSVMEPTIDNILTLAVVSTIIFTTSSSEDKDKDFTLGIVTLYAYLKDLKDKYTLEQVNQMLINKYNFLVHNCTLNKLSVIVHSYETLVGKGIKS